MDYIAKTLLRDCSMPDGFCFSLRCGECGEVWKSRPVRFSRAGIVPRTPGKQVVYDTLYQREKEAALRRAIKQAEERFSQCPICRRVVCDSCFLVCDDLDMCVACARKLQEPGEPVARRRKPPDRAVRQRVTETKPEDREEPVPAWRDGTCP